jgi:hypothetical protein
LTNAAHQLSIALAYLSWMSAAAGQTVIRSDMGGSIDEYAARVAAETGAVSVRGQCYSACTMWLALGDRVCTYRSAQWGFHGATAVDRRMAAIVEPYANWQLARSYTPAVRRRFERSWINLRERNMRVISGAEMIKMGVKECRK